VSSIVFSVCYGLREYLSFVRDFGIWHQATGGGKSEFKSGKRSALARLLHTTTIYLIAPPIFIMKKRAVGDCQFSIDERRVLRRSKSGDLELPWSQVVRVHRLTRAYLVQEERGAMPLPYRSFTPQQLQQFERILHQNAVKTLDAR
jgi:hypothetical protein